MAGEAGASPLKQSRRDAAEPAAGMTAIYGITAGGEVATTYSSFFGPSELVHDVKLLEAP